MLTELIFKFALLRRVLKPAYEYLTKLPPISNSEISEQLILQCVNKHNPVILEVGCNDGSHSLWFAKLFECPTIYCFEPDPRAIKRFKSNTNNHANIKLFEIALSDKNGQASFHQSSGYVYDKDKESKAMPDGWDLSSSIKKPKLHLLTNPTVTFSQLITVRTSTLDDWCEEHKIENIDLIWIDVQGAELEVLRGGKKALLITRYIYTEYANTQQYEGQATLTQLLRYLKSFATLVRYKDDVLLKNKYL